MELKDSPLAYELSLMGSPHRSDAHPSEASVRGLLRLGLGTGEGHLTSLGRATLAALERPELPDPGEPSVTIFNDTRLAEWWFEYDGPAGKASCVVRVEEFQLASGSWVQRVSTSGGTTVPPLLASTLLSAHALAEQWRAERGA